MAVGNDVGVGRHLVRIGRPGPQLCRPRVGSQTVMTSGDQLLARTPQCIARGGGAGQS